jgi:iron-sulfur cluster assembly protein
MKRDIVTVTDGARIYINQRCDGVNTILGVSVNSKGCSGHQYEYKLIDPRTVGPMDETILWPGGGISISARSVMFLIGANLDIKRDGMQEHLQWGNPNATNHCGCGESFSMKT